MPVRSTLPRRAALGLALSPALALGLIVGFAAPAAATDCAADFQAVMAQRQAVMNRLNSFNKKKPTATVACQTLNGLSAADGKVLGWMTKNKDWCQIPDASIEQIRTAGAQSAKVRGQVCGVAAKEAQLIAQAKRAQTAGANGGGGNGDPTADLGPSGLPGSPVRLPRGAL